MVLKVESVMSQNMKQGQMTPSRKSVRLAFKCTGLECEPSVSFQTGMLSGLLNRAKSTATSKTERRSILASVSTSSSGFFDVYRSEVIDDSDDIYPSLVADIKYGAIADTLIRVRILYSCTMTSGKDIILCETVFPLHDIVRDTTIRVSMTSKYLKNNAILEMIVVEPFRPVLQSTSFAPIAKNNPGNPYKQSYMFYSDDISIPRAVYCEEYGLESRISVDVVVAFLDEILRSLSLSISSWARRRDLEIIRQGLFSSLNDAHKHGWHQVTITVLEVRINSTGNDNSPSQFGKVSPQHPSSLIGTDDDDDNNNIEIDKNGKRNPGARGFRRAITTLSGGGMSASRKKGAYDDSKPCTFVEISITDR